MKEEIERIVTRLNNLESQLMDIQGWRDPRNTNGRIETLANSVEEFGKVISNLTQSVAELEIRVANKESTGIIESSADLVAGEEKPKRGRPSKK